MINSYYIHFDINNEKPRVACSMCHGRKRRVIECAGIRFCNIDCLEKYIIFLRQCINQQASMLAELEKIYSHG